ncbi:25997_t:CDS:2 [Dentiscutata erythropus]|uniref:25997_t:CDS:1 n=1 Tax=Dentiscutata erythropus TaxID=1348616 RepID=A0A9N9J356_9GLOM|nr:25997_t:CDS:2 [Dentiscutata erythropus]
MMLLASAISLSLAITTISVTFPIVFYYTIKDCCFPREVSSSRDFKKTVSVIRISDSGVHIISRPISITPAAFEDVKIIQMEGYDELIMKPQKSCFK